MVTKAKRRGKAKRKVITEEASRRRRKTVKVKRPKKKIMKNDGDTPPSLYAVVRIRGSVNIQKSIKDTLDIMRLNRVNHCVLVPSNPSFKGMLHKAEECLTWGEINEQTLEKLIFKRCRIEGKKPGKEKASEIAKKVISADKEDLKKIDIKPVFRLVPPSKGYKSIRKFFPGGDLGYRGDKINELLKRMI